MHHAVMVPAQQRKVRQFGRPALDPPDQVVPVAAAQRPVATREDTMPVAGFQRPPSRRWDGPARMVELVVELAAAGDLRDGRIAGDALYGRRRYRAATLELARRRPRDSRQGVKAGPDDQLRPRASAVRTVAPPSASSRPSIRTMPSCGSLRCR